MANPEVSALDSIPQTVKLADGTHVQIEQLRARQFFKLLRIVTHGSLPMLNDLSFFRMDPDGDAGEFAGRLLSVMLLSIPDAEDETIDFLRSMCKPVGLIERKGLNKVDTERNNALWAQLDEVLANPELDDLITLVEAIVKREAADIQALGKRLVGMFKLAERTGPLPTSPTPESTTPASSEDSPVPSISSPASTDGPTPSSPTSPSPDSASASQPSVSVTSGAVGSTTSG